MCITTFVACEKYDSPEEYVADYENHIEESLTVDFTEGVNNYGVFDTISVIVNPNCVLKTTFPISKNTDKNSYLDYNITNVKLYNKSTGQEETGKCDTETKYYNVITGKWETSSYDGYYYEGYAITFIPDKTLSGNTEYEVEVEMKVYNKEYDVTKIFTKTLNFTTKTSPDNIDPDYVEVTYPINGQKHFLIDDYQTFFLLFTHDYKFLISDLTKFVLTEKDQSPELFSVSTKEDRIYYEIYTETKNMNLKTNTTYNLKLVNFKNSVTSDFTESDYNLLYEINFATSEYKTAKEKFSYLLENSQIKSSRIEQFEMSSNTISTIFTTSIENFEGLDSCELNYLLRVSPDYENTTWFTEKVVPVMYNETLIKVFNVTPPTSYCANLSWSQDGKSWIIYNGFSYEIFKSYNHLYELVINYSGSYKEDEDYLTCKNNLLAGVPGMIYGNYPVVFNYVIPYKDETKYTNKIAITLEKEQ